MAGDMPCREQLFEAESESDYAFLLPFQPDANGVQCIRSFVSALLEEEWLSQKESVLKAATQPRLLLLLFGASVTPAIYHFFLPFNSTSYEHHDLPLSNNLPWNGAPFTNMACNGALERSL